MSKLFTLAPVAIAAGGTVLSFMAVRHEKDTRFSGLLLVVGVIAVVGSLVGIFLTFPDIIRVMRELREQVLRGEWEEAAVVLIVLLIIGFVIYRSKKRNQSPELGDMLRQRDERIAELERLIATQPRHVIKEVHVASGTRAADGSEYFARGIQHEKDYNYDAALADFTRAIEVEPNALHYRTRAWFFWWRRKNTSLAIADYSKAIELGSAAGDYLGRAGMYWEIGNYDRAMADINRAIHLNPQELLYYYLRGLLYQVKGDLRAAKSDLAAVASHHGGEFGRCAQIALKALGKGEKGEWLHGHF